MNRDVMGRQMFANGGPAMPQPEMGMDQMAMMAQEQGVDPAQLQGALEMAQGQMQQIDNAENYEQVINGIRGDQQPIEARYAELTSVVGQEDSQATPESVLTLLQPVMQMAAVDQGIGGLAAEEMTAPIEGPMAEGIMSTVGMGEPDPVNFSQGGPVIHMAEGGAPNAKLAEEIQRQRDLYASVLGTEDREAALADQRRMTKAQMLFDIAQGGFALASPTDRNMSFAERLASSFNPVVGNIGARAGEFQKFKQGQAAEQRALDLQALGQAQSELAAIEERKFRADQAGIERNLRRELATAKTPKGPTLNAKTQIMGDPQRLAKIASGSNSTEATAMFTQLMEDITPETVIEGGVAYKVPTTTYPLETLIAFGANNPSYAAQIASMDGKFAKLVNEVGPEGLRALYFDTQPITTGAPDQAMPITTGAPDQEMPITTGAPDQEMPSATDIYYKKDPIAPIRSSNDDTKEYDRWHKSPDKDIQKNIPNLFHEDFESGQVKVDDKHPVLLTPTPLTDASLKVSKAIGTSSLISGFLSGFDAISGEFGGKVDKSTTDYKTMEAALNAASNNWLQWKNSGQKGRILMSMQNLFNKEVETLRPGGFFRSDTDAMAAAKAMRAQIENDLINSRIYDPAQNELASASYSTDTIRKVKEEVQVLLPIYRDLNNIIKALEGGPANKSGKYKNFNQSDLDVVFQYTGSGGLGRNK